MTNLEEMLKRAYRTKENAEIGTRWETNLMARIREVGPLRPRALFLPDFEHFVWRLAPVFCVLVIVAIALFIGTEIVSWEDPVQFFVSGAEESTLAQLFGA